ncbi:SCO3374 family protein [Streptomyces sp. PTM05]|uniref:SCO3374 family protein n=1 Tax=Streptantibioticus parmotrematis TaxID=2873249 RepID=A0ABS7R163_9ACTN|nr:SCO3374 family protein [Streptantibioticus parmotrematis]MBY8888721.1 SCO3374 family protein [Streptantibioticus parmotrematis]
MGVTRTRERAGIREWYASELGWPTGGTDDAPGLLTGVRFDVLDVPLAAGLAVLRRFARTGPAAALGGRALLLVAAGSGAELPGLLDWLEWSGIPLDLAVRGAGDRIPAPRPAPWGPRAVPAAGTRAAREAYWLRPPVPGHEVEPTLPSLRVGTSVGVGTGAKDDGESKNAENAENTDNVENVDNGDRRPVDLASLVGAVATECHRARLLTAAQARWSGHRTGQACAFSYASRMVAGTRPRSLTS